MFIGHYAPAFLAASVASKRTRVPLALGFVATQLVDIGFFGFSLLGIEHFRMVPGATAMNAMDLYDLPWTHSLLGCAGWAALFAFFLWLWRRGWRFEALGAALVLSHWLLDLLVHRPDLTLDGGPPKLGLGLWNHPAIEMPLELGLTLVCLIVYLWRTRASGTIGRIAPALLVLTLLGLQIVNWSEPQPGHVIDPAPASASWLALTAYALLTLMAWWVDSTRHMVSHDTKGDFGR